MPDRDARAALSTHFTPDQTTTDLARYTPPRAGSGVYIDSSGRPAQYKPHDGRANARDIRSIGSALLLAEQRAALCPNPERALALL